MAENELDSVANGVEETGTAGVRRFEDLPAPAQRALREAEERRLAAIGGQAADKPGEVNGRGGLDPVRYGDWEINGKISDF